MRTVADFQYTYDVRMSCCYYYSATGAYSSDILSHRLPLCFESNVRIQRAEVSGGQRRSASKTLFVRKAPRPFSV